MNKENQKTKWIVWYKYNIINTACDEDRMHQEFQDAIEHTSLAKAIWDYLRISWEFYQCTPIYKDVFPDVERGLGFDIKLYRIK